MGRWQGQERSEIFWVIAVIASIVLAISIGLLA
jgi:hypothetical protein